MNPAADYAVSAAQPESAPYGRACAGCSKAKCRCIMRGEGLSCKRCHRLQRECHPSMVVRKRSAKRPAHRTAELEKKLDSLVTLLRSQPPGGSRVSEDSSETSPGGNSGGPRQSGSGTEQSQGTQEPPCFYPTPITAAASPYPEPSPSQAQEYFEDFIKTYVHAFPFIHFSASTTAAQLQAQWPFLWLNIRTNCCKSVAERHTLEVKIREIAAQKLLVDLERSMDLLLGLICFLSWTSEKYKGKPLLSTFSHLTMSLLSDLRIDKHVQELPCRELSACRAYSYPIKQIIPATHRTNEERRAVLGCYVACATTTWFLKTAPMGWTPHMEDCMRYLMANPETQNDWILITQARLSKILEDLNSAGSWRPSESLPIQSSYPPALMHVKALRANLKEVRDSTPDEVLADKRIVSYLLATEAMVNELPLYPLDRAPGPPGSVDFERTECFYACLNAIKGCLDNFFSVTDEEILGYPMPVHLHFSRCTHILYRLLLMDDPAWNRSAISSTIDLFDTLERCAERYFAVPAKMGLDTDGTDIYTRAAEVLRNTVPLWQRALEDVGAIPGAAVAATEEQSADPVVGQGLATMDISVDGWFSDVFSICDTY